MANLVFIAQDASLHGDKHTGACGPCVLAFEIWYLSITHSIFFYTICDAGHGTWRIVFFRFVCGWETAERLDTDRRRRKRLPNVSLFLFIISSESLRWLQAPWLPPAVEGHDLWQESIGHAEALHWIDVGFS